MQLTVNLTRVDPQVRHGILKNLRHEDKARHALGVLEQIRLKKMMDAVAEPGFNRDIGRTSMILSPGQYQAAQGQYGETCFQDPAFAHWLLKVHPEFRVKDVGTRVQSGWTPESEKGRNG